MHTNTTFNSKSKYAIDFVNNITIKNFNETTDLLIKYAHIKTTEEFYKNNVSKTIYIVTGPIGAGKSVISENLIRVFELENLDFVSPDIFYKVLFGDIPEIEIKYEMGKQSAENRKNKLIDNNKSFIWETVISKEEKFNFINKCKQHDYKIVGFFVGTESPSICINRVNKRHLEGEHPVSQEKVIARYYDCMNNFQRFSSMTNELYVIDNTDEKPVLLLYEEHDNKHNRYIAPNTKEWFLKISQNYDQKY